MLDRRTGPWVSRAPLRNTERLYRGGGLPRDAVEPLQQSLSCLSKCILRWSGCDPDNEQQLTLSKPTGADLITKEGEILYLSFAQRFSIIKHFLLRYKIQTRAYYYGLEDQSNNEIIAYHWHPETSRFQFPHFHLRHDVIGKIHFPTGRIALEEFCQLLITEFQVVPERADAMEVLAGNLKKFKDHKTW